MRGRMNGIDDLYQERTPLYEKYADVTVDCNEKTLAEIAEEISKLILE